MATFKHIVAATDFSETSRAAIELACAMAREGGAALTVVHVCEVPGYDETGPIPYDVATPIVAGAERELDGVMSRVRASCPDAAGVVKIGAAPAEILALAADVRADLVVLGTHGRSGISRAVRGSVAEWVIANTPFDVAIARPHRATLERR
jgi:nucleotide-binding universal stress UspA family protein